MEKIGEATIKSIYWSYENNVLRQTIELIFNEKLFAFGGLSLNGNKAYEWLIAFFSMMNISACEEEALKNRTIKIKYIDDPFTEILAIGNDIGNKWIYKKDFS